MAKRTNLKTLDEAAQLSGVPRRTLQRWLFDGDLTAYAIKSDSRRYVDMAEIGRLRTPRRLPYGRRAQS